MQKILLVDVIDTCKEKLIDVLYYSGAARTKSYFKCQVCDYSWWTTFSHIKRRRCCPNCSKHAPIMLIDVHNYCRNVPFKLYVWGGTSKAISTFKCDICGHIWKTTFSHVKHSRSGCPRCHHTLLLTESEVIEYCKAKSFKLKFYGGSASVKSKFICDICQYEWNTSFTELKSKHRGCPKCSKKYLYNNKAYDSSWEVIVDIYETNLGKEVIRLEGRQKEYCLEYEFEGKKCKWYPDFLIDGELVEVKPKRGFKMKKDSVERIKAKKQMHPEVRWIQDEDIKEMKKIVGDVSKYKQQGGPM